MERNRGKGGGGCEEEAGEGTGLSILRGQKANSKNRAIWERKLWGEGRMENKAISQELGVEVRTEAKARGGGGGQMSEAGWYRESDLR